MSCILHFPSMRARRSRAMIDVLLVTIPWLTLTCQACLGIELSLVGICLDRWCLLFNNNLIVRCCMLCLFLRLRRPSKIPCLLEHKASSKTSPKTSFNRHRVSAAKWEKTIGTNLRSSAYDTAPHVIWIADYYCTSSLATNRQSINSLRGPATGVLPAASLTSCPRGACSTSSGIGDLCVLLKTYCLRKAADNFQSIEFSPFESGWDINEL